MLAFEIWLNGERTTVAGVEDWSILSFHLTAMRERTPGLNTGNEISTSMGGMTLPDSNEVCHHFRWGRSYLPIGSIVTIRVIETESPDAPLKRYRSDRETQECPYSEEEMRQMRYEGYIALKAEFESDSGSENPAIMR